MRDVGAQSVKRVGLTLLKPVHAPGDLLQALFGLRGGVSALRGDAAQHARHAMGAVGVFADLAVLRG